MRYTENAKHIKAGEAGRKKLHEQEHETIRNPLNWRDGLC